ncbi:hypothetical protein M9H77_32558 [Catharanthus roseus]|uniref:Uncharacterized protein n=1 Tax=Catharanthus roseus TaxID=4058 RepID=A0ACC0A473_CATRO|nr:hypothetical protein M9H77_32558 [Catharanthus roseus]
MANVSGISRVVIVFAAIVFAIFMPASVHGHSHDSFAPAPAPASDGTTIDQGIAYVLMLLALVLTYIIHTLDAPIIF